MPPSAERATPVRRHDGSAARDRDVFFVAPDSRVGTVLSAATSLDRDASREHSWFERRMRITYGLYGSLVGLVASGPLYFLLLDRGVFTGSNDRAMWLVIVACALVAGALTWLVVRPPKTCTYVGTAGVQRSRRYRSGRIVTEVLAWSDAREMKAARVRHFVDGIDAGVSLEQTWKSESGKKLFTIRGVHEPRDGRPPEGADHPVYFAQAAECAWLERRVSEVAPAVPRERGLPARRLAA